MQITIEYFNAYLPALRSADERLFVKCNPYIMEALGELELFLCGYALPENITMDTPTIDVRAREEAQRWVCLRGAEMAVPHLDLVATPTGFGVVSNQNVAPASANRVSELRRALIRDTGESKCRLARLLRQTDWRGTDAAVAYFTRHLFYDAPVCRDYGLTYTTEGKLKQTITRAEFEIMQDSLMNAETYVRELFGEAFVNYTLADRLNLNREVYDVQAETAFLKLAAAHVHRLPAEALYAIKRAIIRSFEKDIDHFPLFQSSPEYRALHAEHFTNRDGDPTFFFG